MNVLSEHGFRADGRRPEQIRNISCKLSVCPEADGSAYIEQGNTRIMCAVYGPHEATNRAKASEEGCSVSVQLSTAVFATLERKNRRRGDRKTTALARMLEKAFESVIVTSLFPRAQIDICCEIIQEDGSRLSSCINACSLALADAGIPMRGVVTCVTCSSVDGRPVVDISAREEMDTIPRLTLATLSGHDEVVLVEMENRVHMDHLSALMAASHAASSSIHQCLHAALQQHLSQTRAIL
ncbi:exos-4.1 [Pristionchus pacificus]|uniref:Putative exosome complex component RRP41 n=1 Tax=Pristionchus pacificus TaxID=54126 RepID=A0A2A6C8C9_PRIPA|nr:exos-4.1 [Pristionchus pacificus]|eukprot:PDM74434.1 exos-4.1 [Pristionchus pacificus]